MSRGKPGPPKVAHERASRSHEKSPSFASRRSARSRARSPRRVRRGRARSGRTAGRGCAWAVRAGSPTPTARSGTSKLSDLSSSRRELDVTTPLHRRTKNSIWGLLACECEHLLAPVHRMGLRPESRHMVMSQMWPLLRARSRSARHEHLHFHAGADRRLPGGGGRVVDDVERLCARAHGRSATPDRRQQRQRGSRELVSGRRLGSLRGNQGVRFITKA